MPVRRRRRGINNWQARRFRGEEKVVNVPTPGTTVLGDNMPKPDSKGKVLPPPGEPVTNIRIYPA